MNETNICHQGIVKEIAENTLFVQIERHNACTGCHAKNVCSTFGQKDEIIQVFTQNPETFQQGETVRVSMQQSLGLKAIVIAYLCPFFVLVTCLFLTYYLTNNELLSVIVALVSTVLYYLIIKKIENRLKKRFFFFVNKINE
jgi:sigma-E factor negative regulatory protein RseC